MTSRPRILPAVLLAAILGISISGPLARLAQAEPLAIAVWRLALALAVIAIALLVTGEWREWRQLSRRDLAVAAGAGVLLALHFWSWIASLGMTSVAASVLLVNLHPVVIVAGSALWLRERPTRVQVLGLGLSLAGAAVIGLGDAMRGSAGGPAGSAALGNALALLGAITVGLYYLAGRSLRQRLSLWPYVGLVYGTCLLALLVFAAATGTHLWPFAQREWLLFAGIALGPMLLGHTGFNWSLRHVPAYVVSLAVLAEPVGAALLAYLLPGIGETPAAHVLAGGAVVLAGLVLGVRGEG
ncbi:MAG: DMT family transporter [Gemmatimonadaceae bacterium]|nr:DMT family transporter [Gemmatimonadaceae bacterium]